MKVFERVFIIIEGSISGIIDRIAKLWDILRGLDESEIIKIMRVMREIKIGKFKKTARGTEIWLLEACKNSEDTEPLEE